MDKFINRWEKAGLIDNNLAKVLLADLKHEKEKIHRIQLNILIYTIAAIFIGMGLITFVAANDWLIKIFTDFPILQILLLTSITISLLFYGYKLAYEGDKFKRLGTSMIFLSSLAIGGCYALVGQTYNTNANSAPLFFVWMFSVLPLAFVFKNYAINILSIILFIIGVIFYYVQLDIDTGLIWTIFIPILIGVGLYSFGNVKFIQEKYNDFSFSYKIAGLTPIFITLLVLICSVEKSYFLQSVHYLTPLFVLLIFNAFNYFLNDIKTTLFKIENVFLVALILFLIILLNLNSINPFFIMFLSNIAIILVITFGYNYGYKYEKYNLVGLINWFLIIYVTVNYCRWGWSLLDKALFFIIGGMMLLGIGMYLENKRKQIFKKGNN